MPAQQPTQQPKVILHVDHDNGTVVPDKQVESLAKDILERSLTSNETIEQSVGADLMVTAFRHGVKTMGLPAGHVVLAYKGGKTVSLDQDGMSDYLHPDSLILNKLLMELF
ncbi:MAG: hypothetical protein GY833_23190 [Aestuariibacter sp.]|nr:hypothetical protein [Aestuariibacter sp.]